MIRQTIHRTSVSAVLLAALATAAGATPPQDMTVASLKSTYLDCERRALVLEIAPADVMLCSVIYEELKMRAFEGDWQRLRLWTERNLNQTQDV